jgi:hypothetical protein
MKPPGKKRWFVADAYLPSSGQGSRWESHESICILNVSDADAQIRLSLYFEDRPAIEGIPLAVKSKSNKHFRMDQPERLAGTQIPRDVPFGLAVESDVPVICQYSRLDVTQPNFTLMTTIPYSQDD